MWQLLRACICVFSKCMQYGKKEKEKQVKEEHVSHPHLCRDSLILVTLYYAPGDGKEANQLS